MQWCRKLESPNCNFWVPSCLERSITLHLCLCYIVVVWFRSLILLWTFEHWWKKGYLRYTRFHAAGALTQNNHSKHCILYINLYCMKPDKTSFKSPRRDKHSWIKFNARHIWALRNPFRDGWGSPLLARGSCVLHQTQICGITLTEPSHKWISCCVWSLIGESVHHVAICLCTSSLLSHFPRNQHPVVWVTPAMLSSAFIYLFIFFIKV